jgi:mannitol/fructose-specific phosphotransferase system IIA component
MTREQLGSTAIGQATAVPHAYADYGLSRPVVVFVRLAHAVNLGAPDGVPTRYFFVLLGPEGSADVHLETLAHIARLMSDDEFRYDAGEARSRQNLLDALARFRIRTMPPSEKGPEKAAAKGLQFTGRLGGGLIGDLRRRLQHYASDWRDGLNAKCIASTLFLFFACLAPAVTFGGMMAVGTGGQIGAVEMIVATAICGVAFALLSGQPLIILGGTGPMLIYTVILFQLCGDLEIEFLPAYAWVGFWTAGILIVLTLADASALMRYFTRFTDDIFAALIAIIFIYEAIRQLYEVFEEAFETGTVSHDKAFLSLILAAGTFYIGMTLSGFRRSRYLLPKMREFLADFGPSIALATMTLVAIRYHGEVRLDALDAPETVGPTLVGRAWLIDPFQAPRWVWLAAAIPGTLGAVLVFLDQNITARLVNSPDHRLTKGEAYHLDLGLVGVLVGVCSAIGLPWLVPATVRSLNHVHSLATVEEVIGRGGTRSEQIVHVRETRVSGLLIHVLIGLSLLALPLLKMIPMAVLYGIFLYMGVVSMKGNQFFQRLSLWPTDPSLYPASHYIRRVPLRVIHTYTLLQLACLAVLWAVKEWPNALVQITFPLLLVLLVPVRIIAGRFFEPAHLAILDAEESPSEEETDWGAG